MSNPKIRPLTNPWADVDEGKMSRVQADIPDTTKAYFTGLFARRGPLQEIINTALYLIEIELRKDGILSYDESNEQRVADVLARLTRGPDEQRQQQRLTVDTTTGGPASDKPVILLRGNHEQRASTGSDSTGQPAPIVTAETSARNPVGGGDATGNRGTPTDADSTSHNEGGAEPRKPNAGSKNRSSKTQTARRKPTKG